MNKIDIKKQTSNLLSSTVKKLTGLDFDVEISVPSDLRKGDFSSNVAMVAFGQIKNKKLNLKSPMDLAEKISKQLNSNSELQENFGKIETAPPGFINFWLSTEALQRNIETALSGFSNKHKNREVLFEFGQQNPFKEPHIGHLRNLVLGESLARLLEFEGAKVHRVNYQGDVGLHVAKALWGLLEASPAKQGFGQFSDMDKLSLEGKAKLLSEAYVRGASAFEKTDSAKKEIAEINNKLYQKDSQLLEIWEKGRRWSLDYFEELYKRLDIKYDKYYFESVTAPLGFGLVRENGKVFEKDAGAYIFRGENYGLHTRVFVTKDGYSTYEAKDLALAHLKDKDFSNYDLSLIMTANEQVEYFKVLLKALTLVNKKIGEKTGHVSLVL